MVEWQVFQLSCGTEGQGVPSFAAAGVRSDERGGRVEFFTGVPDKCMNDRPWTWR